MEVDRRLSRKRGLAEWSVWPMDGFTFLSLNMAYFAFKV